MSKPLMRYKVQQDKGVYALKGCDDGDLVDWSEYERLQRALQRIASGESYPAGIARAALGFRESAQETSPARMQELNAKYAGRERGDDGGELTPKLSEQP